MVSRGGFGKALAVLALALFFIGTLSIAPGLAQDPGADDPAPEVLIQGRVLWVAAETLVIAPYVPMMGAINVDLSQADQAEYAGLRTGDVVAVTGTAAPEGDRVIATSIRRLAAS
jgi:hypothetical protein